MKVIDNEIGENGLSRILVNNGYGDLKVKVGREEITCVRSILMNGNETIRKLLLDEKQGEVLELYEKCEINSFLEIEKYYSGGMMELNEDNVCDILRFSVYYSDNRIMRIFKDFFKENMSDKTMIEIFEILNGLNINKLDDLRNISEKYINKNGFKYLNDDELLLRMSLKSIKFILGNKKLMIISESWLLNQLLKWYRLKLKESEEKEEELEEFIRIIKTKIHLNEIQMEEIEEENLKELKELNISIEEYMNDHICVKVKGIENNVLMEIIKDNHEEEREIELNERMVIELNKEEVKEEMVKLLANEDIKIIEIVLDVIMKLKMNEIIPNEIKSKLLGEICLEYIRNKSNRSLRNLCLFVDDKTDIVVIEKLCGKVTLFRMLNEEYYLNSKVKQLLIKYIQEMKLNIEMLKVIENEEIKEILKTINIISFSYPQSEYIFGINEEISIIPYLIGNRCEFSISPSLPLGLTINKESGIIHGKVENEIEKIEYEVTCKNVRNEIKLKILLEFVDIKFTELNKSEGISISNNGKLITNVNDRCDYCYLNLKMENGIYHIKYQFHKNESNYDELFLGLSTKNKYFGEHIFNQSTTCNYCAWDSENQDISGYCSIGTVVNKNPNFNDHGDGSIYEVIVDMNKREFSISHNNSSPVLLVKDLPSPLYPYAELDYKNTSVELLSVSYQN